MKLYKNGSFAQLLFLFICSLLLASYFTYIYIDIFYRETYEHYSCLFKYFSSILCFILSLLLKDRSINKRDILSIQLTLLISTVGDYYNVIAHKYIIGVLMFCLVQIIYTYRHCRKIKNAICTDIITFSVIFIPVLLLIKTFYIDRPLYIFCIYYASILITSLWYSLKTLNTDYFPTRNSLLIALGMILFFASDFSILLFNFPNMNNVYIFNSVTVSTFSGIMIWALYLPSQLLLCLSSYKFRES